jgi:hypothetical protein
MKQTKIVIQLQGDDIKVEAQGYMGKACVEDLKWLDDLLGQPKNRTFKDEYRKVEAIKISR